MSAWFLTKWLTDFKWFLFTLDWLKEIDYLLYRGLVPYHCIELKWLQFPLYNTSWSTHHLEVVSAQVWSDCNLFTISYVLLRALYRIIHMVVSWPTRIGHAHKLRNSTVIYLSMHK